MQDRPGTIAIELEVFMWYTTENPVNEPQGNALFWGLSHKSVSFIFKIGFLLFVSRDDPFKLFGGFNLVY